MLEIVYAAAIAFTMVGWVGAVVVAFIIFTGPDE